MKKYTILYIAAATVAAIALYFLFVAPAASAAHQVLWLAVLLAPTALVANRIWALKAVRHVYWHRVNILARATLVAAYAIAQLMWQHPWDSPENALTFRLGALFLYILVVAPVVAFVPYYPVRYLLLGQLRTPTGNLPVRDALPVGGQPPITNPQTTLWDLDDEHTDARAVEYLKCADAAVNTLRNRVVLHTIDGGNRQPTPEMVLCEQHVHRAWIHLDCMMRAPAGSAEYVRARTAVMAESYTALTHMRPPLWGLGLWTNPLVGSARGTSLRPHMQTLRASLEQAQHNMRERVTALNPLMMHAKREANAPLVRALTVHIRTVEALLEGGIERTERMLSLCPNTRAMLPSRTLKQLYELYSRATEQLIAAHNLHRVLAKFQKEYELSLEVVGYIKTAMGLVPHLHEYVQRTGNRFYVKYANHREETLNEILEARSESSRDGQFLAQLQQWVDTTMSGAPTNLNPQTHEQMRLLSAQIATTRTRRALAEIIVYAAALTPADTAEKARTTHLLAAVNEEEANASNTVQIQPQALKEAHQLRSEVRSLCLNRYPQMAQTTAPADLAAGALYEAMLQGAAYAVEGLYVIRTQMVELQHLDRAPNEKYDETCRYWPLPNSPEPVGKEPGYSGGSGSSEGTADGLDGSLRHAPTGKDEDAYPADYASLAGSGDGTKTGRNAPGNTNPKRRRTVVLPTATD